MAWRDRGRLMLSSILHFPSFHPSSSLLDHPNAHFRLDVRMQADRYSIHSERLDRLVEIDLPLLDVEAMGLQLLRDVAAGHRAEEFALVADSRRERERHLLELFRISLRGATTLVLRGLEAVAFLLDALEVARRGVIRQ